MARKTKRRSVSMRPHIYARLMHYTEVMHPEDPAVNGSSVTEAALTAYLDARGVPAEVELPPERERDEPDAEVSDAPVDHPAHFTF